MITAAICVALVVGALVSRGLDRFEGWAQTRRDEKRYAARFRAKSSVVSASFGAGRDGEK